jgi:hypothetical protein
MQNVSFKIQLLVACFFLLTVQQSMANNAVYEQRKQDYVDTSLVRNGSKLILQAYRSLPLDMTVLNSKLSAIANGTTSDFTIIELIRLLFLTNGTYDAQILPVLNSVPYWINNADTVRNFWSENHMIMWMSSDWLLHEKYNRPIDNTLDARLRHYLRLKVQYGFYEFFSSTYAPYSLSGLLNLADFSQDVEIKNLATQASQRLLADFLKLTNDKGVFYPIAGRNYPGKYDTPYGQNHNNLIYLLTGMGEAPSGASAAGPFLASSTIEVDTVIASWKPILDTVFFIGHTLDSGLIINSGMSPVDKTVFQWSSGGYFHPTVVSSTVQLLEDSNMWRHVDFELLRPLQPIITPQSAPTLSESLGVISKSTVISGQEVSIFKHNSITLSSISDFWKGKVGFQQYPCVANVGTIPVYTASGEVKANWNDRSPNNQNVHLPYVKQKKNVALLMYRPEFTPELLGNNFTYKDVTLRWNDAAFDEVVNDSMWLIGREVESYVAVRRSCIGEINGLKACPTVGGQTWVIVVGDSGLYGSFNNFKNIVHQSQFEERWYNDTANSQLVYYSKIVFDTTSIEYAWGADSTFTTGIEVLENSTADLMLFPNPSNNEFSVNLQSFSNQPLLLKATNLMGEVVHQEQIAPSTSNHKTINASNWAEGVYIIEIEGDSGVARAKFIKSK